METNPFSESDFPDFSTRQNPWFRRWFTFIQSTPTLAMFVKLPTEPSHQPPHFRDVFRAVLAGMQASKRRETKVEAIRLCGQLVVSIGGLEHNLEREELRRATSVLGKLLLDNDPRITGGAADALMTFARGEFASDVCEIIAHFDICATDSAVAVSLLKALRVAGQDAAAVAVPAIIHAARRHNDPVVKVMSCALLGELKEDGVLSIDDLIFLLSGHEEEEVRAAAVRALGSFLRLPSLKRLEQVRKALLNSAVNDLSDAVKLTSIDQLFTQDDRRTEQVALLCEELDRTADGTAINAIIKVLMHAGEAYRPLRLALSDRCLPVSQSTPSKAEALRKAASKVPTLRRNLNFLAQYDATTSETYHRHTRIAAKFKKSNPHAINSDTSKGGDMVKKGIERARKFLKDHKCTAAELLQALDSPEK